jgi:hypothetical protein
MGLTANRDVDHFVDQELRSYRVSGSAHVFKGGFVGVRWDGFVRPLVAGDRCVGLAYEEADNTGGMDGDVSVRVFTLGDFRHVLAGATRVDIGRAVYAVADDSLTFDPDGTSLVGYVQDCDERDIILLRLVTLGPMGAARISHHPTDFSLSPHDSGSVHTNRGARGLVTATLPAAPPAGTEFRFVGMADQPMRLAPTGSGAIFIHGAKKPGREPVTINEVGDFVHLMAAGRGDWVAVAASADAEHKVEPEPGPRRDAQPPRP